VSDRATVEPVPAAPPPARGRRGWSRRRVRLAGMLAGALLVVVTAGLAVWLPGRSGGGTPVQPAAVPASWARPAVRMADLAGRTGVRITRVAVTGNGGLLDLRYQVVDPDKAGVLHDTATPPALVDERTGLVVHQLLMDHAHSGAYRAGVTYYLVFENPGNWVRRGSAVTVLLGNAQVEHVVVR